MQITPVSLQATNKLVSNYKANDRAVMDFFDYECNQYEEKRLVDISNRIYQREALVKAIHTLHKEWEAPAASNAQLDRLLDERSVAVVGGQQAGLLTGPLYSVHKVISIIQLAKQQEEKLGVPVVPIFWIAGEDHDFEEINHVYVPTTGMEMKKVKQSSSLLDAGKKSVSELEFQHDIIEQWAEVVSQTLSETAYTQDIYELIRVTIRSSNSYTEFFAKLIFKLFPDQGIVLLDSHAKEIRALETDYFLEMIQYQKNISKSVKDSIDTLAALDYIISLDVSTKDGHLFYHDEQLGRILLQVTEKGDWVGKQQEVQFSQSELESIAIHSPHLLSNNVVTRPLMQEKLIPTLAFIGGPGEISYWAALKKAFHILGMEMPPIVPRMTFTYIDRHTSKLLDKYQLDASTVLTKGAKEEKQQFLHAKSDPNIDELSEEVKQQLTDIHEPLRSVAASMGDDIKALSEKNLTYLLNDVDFLKKRLNKEIHLTYATEINEFNRIEMVLHPNGGLQERVWNPLYVLNHCGMDIFSKMANKHYSFDEDHWIVNL